ncbi:MAG: class I SAM-dependent rRNA methyltransferase [Brumimicrobium sp.]|nr:class I SAM-dependent rRNA methyltransferase [Brumimicrobium sp.]
MKTIRLKKGKEDFLFRKHPWIFSGAIQSETNDLTDGELVRLVDHTDEFCAIGFFQPGSIAVRIITFEEEEINVNFWVNRLNSAVQLRKSLGLISSDTNICRLVHGEGDQCSGLIIDFYNGVAVIQAHAVGIYREIKNIAQALKKVMGDDLKAIYSKSKETLPERTDAENGYLLGACKVPHLAQESGHTFSVNWEAGQKTGFFIDQRENRKLLAKYSQGKKVLNTFCYSGGFSIYALGAGALEVHSLDSSAHAIQLAEKNVEIQHSQERHKSIIADAVKYMNELEGEYDLIILDPPAFAKHKNKRHQAIKAYTRLNANAIRQIKTGGIIFTFSCSQVVDAFQFQKAVVNAAIKTGRNVRILEQLHQPADHPIHAFHPEGEYLKGLILQVE